MALTSSARYIRSVIFTSMCIARLDSSATGIGTTTIMMVYYDDLYLIYTCKIKAIKIVGANYLTTFVWIAFNSYLKV